MRFGHFESGDRPEGAHVELGAVPELVVAVGLLDVQQVGQRPRLESVAEEARPGTEPDVRPETEGAVAGGLDLELQLVQAESPGVGVRVVERVVPVGGVVRVVGVVGVHQAGDGKRLSAGTGDALGHCRAGVLCHRDGHAGTSRGAGVGGREGQAGLRVRRRNFGAAGGHQGRQQDLEVLDPFPQRIQFTADLGFQFHGGRCGGWRRLAGRHGRRRRESAGKDRDGCRTRKSRLHDVSSAHPGLYKRNRATPSPVARPG